MNGCMDGVGVGGQEEGKEGGREGEGDNKCRLYSAFSESFFLVFGYKCLS